MTAAGPVRACIGLGGNVGDAASSVRTGLEAMDWLPDTRLLRGSRLYRTPAWGREDQPDFINAAALVETTLTARALLDALLSLERDLGRDRAGAVHWGPRTIDLDLLLYGDHVIDEPGLHVPHPHLRARAFVLVPLMDVAPDASIPGHGTVRSAHAAVVADGIEAIP